MCLGMVSDLSAAAWDDATVSDVTEAKSAVRGELRQKWRGAARPGSVTPQLLPFILSKIDVSAAPVVAGFIRHGHEVDVQPLLANLAAAGAKRALPRVVGADLEFACWDGGDLVEGPFGLLEPLGQTTVDIGSIAVVLAPAMACSLDGVRLGRGGGFYDRALAQVHSGAVIIGVVDDDSVFPAGALPWEVHDIRVQAIATPTSLHVV